MIKQKVKILKIIKQSIYFFFKIICVKLLHLIIYGKDLISLFIKFLYCEKKTLILE